MVNSPLLKETSDKSQTCKGFQTHPLDWNGSTCIPSEQNMTFSIQLTTAVVRPFSQYIHVLSMYTQAALQCWISIDDSTKRCLCILNIIIYLCARLTSATRLAAAHGAEIRTMLWEMSLKSWFLFELITAEASELWFQDKISSCFLDSSHFFCLNVRSRNSTCS